LAELTVGPVEELPPGEVKIVRAGELTIGVYNLNGDYYAIEDRCSHDDGPLAEGDFDVGPASPSARGTAPSSTCAPVGR
jgi:nitrite reductase/ring-hydroxylating ferredoxin subunit